MSNFAWNPPKKAPAQSQASVLTVGNFTCGYTEGGEFFIREGDGCYSKSVALVIPRNHALEIAKIIAGHTDPSRGIEPVEITPDMFTKNEVINRVDEACAARDNYWRQEMNLRAQTHDQALEEAYQKINELKSQINTLKPYGEEVEIAAALEHLQEEETTW